MSEYTSRVIWKRENQDFIDNKYSRGHIWLFDGGQEVRASSSPQIVPVPYSTEENVDPEEAFVAALSSCHMLFFLSIAAENAYIVEEYIDNAVGVMEKNELGKFSITRVTLRPEVKFSGPNQPGYKEIEAMHHESHENCFIANSVKTMVEIEIMNN